MIVFVHVKEIVLVVVLEDAKLHALVVVKIAVLVPQRAIAMLAEENAQRHARTPVKVDAQLDAKRRVNPLVKDLALRVAKVHVKIRVRGIVLQDVIQRAKAVVKDLALVLAEMDVAMGAQTLVLTPVRVLALGGAVITAHTLVQVLV